MATNPEPFAPPVFYPARIEEGLVEAPAESNNAVMAGAIDAAILPPPPTSFERSTSLSGNILIVQTPQGERAYWLQRKMCKTTRGSVRLGFRVAPLEANHPASWAVQPSTGGPYPYEMAAVKIQDKAACEHTTKASRDPNVEFSALQLVARDVGEVDPDGTSVVTGVVCADNEHIYTIMPFFGEGSLAQYVVERGRLSEGVARHFFKQIISVSSCVGLRSKIQSSVPVFIRILTIYFLYRDSTRCNTQGYVTMTCPWRVCCSAEQTAILLVLGWRSTFHLSTTLRYLLVRKSAVELFCSI